MGTEKFRVIKFKYELNDYFISRFIIAMKGAFQ